MRDAVKTLGHLALGTRLKRLGERLQSQAQEVLAADGIDVQASQLPVLATLARFGPLTVGELTEALGVSQPAVTRLAGKLQADGWVHARQDAGDLRVRRIGLTRAGQALVSRAQRTTWPLIEAAVAEACAGGSGSLLSRLAGLEDALASTPLAARIAKAGARRHASA